MLCCGEDIYSLMALASLSTHTHTLVKAKTASCENSECTIIGSNFTLSVFYNARAQGTQRALSLTSAHICWTERERKDACAFSHFSTLFLSFFLSYYYTERKREKRKKEHQARYVGSVSWGFCEREREGMKRKPKIVTLRSGHLLSHADTKTATSPTRSSSTTH